MDVSVFIGFLFGFIFCVAGGTFYYYFAVKKIKARYTSKQKGNVVTIPADAYSQMDFNTEHSYNKKVL